MLFKYIKSQHAKSFFEDGTLRIGTLYEYRNEEKHGKVIGDNEEGTKRLYTKQQGEDVWTGETIPEHLRQHVRIPEGASARFENNIFINSISSEDVYLFCVTKSFSKAVMSEFNADMCIAIKDPNKFFAAIDAKMQHHGAFQGVFSCQYVPRTVKHTEDHGVPPALIKDPSYRKQQEARAIWTPKNAVLTPVFIDCPEARQYTSIHYGEIPA